MTKKGILLFSHPFSLVLELEKIFKSVLNVYFVVFVVPLVSFDYVYPFGILT